MMNLFWVIDNVYIRSFLCMVFQFNMAVSVPMTTKEIGADAGTPRRTTSMDSYYNKDTEAQTLPNYLRASLGSCHDFCKFGRKRDLTVETRSTMSGTPPLSPNTSRDSNRSNYLKKRISLSSSSGSPSSFRSPVSNVRVNGIQLEAKKLEATAKSPRKLTMKPFEKKVPPNPIWNYGGNSNKQIQSPRGIKKSTSLPRTGCSLSPKPEVRKLQKRSSCSKTKDTKADIEPTESVEDIPEKILFVTELNQAVGFSPEQNIFDGSLECQRHNSDACLLQNSEDESFVDKEIDLVHFSSSPKESNDPKSHEWDYENEMSNIVLRHQNVEQRSAEGLLFNDMIEETARKLAKTKNSKVKALVDAFESVISFQDLSLQEQLKCGESPKFPLCGE